MRQRPLTFPFYITIFIPIKEFSGSGKKAFIRVIFECKNWGFQIVYPNKNKGVNWLIFK